MLIQVEEHSLPQAGEIHSRSWQASHRSFCTPEFVAAHTPEAQTEYLRRELAAGKRIWMLVEEAPVGIVSVHGSLIENLYVLPEKQRRGYGTRLLQFAMEQCSGAPTLWILNTNAGALRLYTRHGFKETGNRKPLKGGMFEMELSRRNLHE